MDSTTTLKITTPELDLIRRALQSHLDIMAAQGDRRVPLQTVEITLPVAAITPETRRDANDEAMRTAEMLEELGVRGPRPVRPVV